MRGVEEKTERPRVVVVGGGFGGLYATKALARKPVNVTLVDKRNFHLFQPLLYQVATGGLSPADIASPIRYVLRRQKNATVVLDEVIDFRPKEGLVVLRRGVLPYDFLVVAAGARVNYFGHPDWVSHAPGLKDIEDAREIRHRVLSAFEAAEQATEPNERMRLLTFVIVGGGPTGVELAGAVAELARETLPKDFRHVDTKLARIIVVEGGGQVLPALSPRLAAKAGALLKRLGVEVWTDSLVADVTERSVRVDTQGGERQINAGTTIWAAGVSGSPLGQTLGQRMGATVDRCGRLLVGSDCSVSSYENVFVIGDLARFDDPSERPLPGIAPVAMQQGRYVARVIARRAAGRSDTSRFQYRDRGDLATIGRRAAVARIGRLEFSGYPAWVIWLFVHLLYVVEFENRLLVLIQWAWNYLTWNRSARLITSEREGEAPEATPNEARPT
jgi:NADH dehydrogenase